MTEERTVPFVEFDGVRISRINADTTVKTYDQRSATYVSEDELTGFDYLASPLADLICHPDFNQKALRVVLSVASKTSAELEGLMFVVDGVT